MENLFNVMLDDSTTGTLNSDCLDEQNPTDFIGEFVTISGHDENGFTCDFEGVLAEVF
jgi:hypothetical protein